MPPSFQTGDFVFAGLAALLAALGLFRGFSGVVAFSAASFAAAAAAAYGWPCSAVVSATPWVRYAVVGVAGLLVFGLTRIVVKKAVNGLLAQPTDALAGLLVGIAVAAAVLVAASRFVWVRERSLMAREVAARVW